MKLHKVKPHEVNLKHMIKRAVLNPLGFKIYYSKNFNSWFLAEKYANTVYFVINISENTAYRLKNFLVEELNTK